jgi:hypothetical protein
MPLFKLTSYLLDEWHNYFDWIKNPQIINYLGISGSVEGGTTTFLAFGPKGNKPLFVVKVYRYDNTHILGSYEIDVLKSISAKGNSISETIPRIVTYRDIDGRRLIVQSILEGKPMVARLAKIEIPEIKHSHDNFTLATDWLRDLHFCTKTDDTGLRVKLKDRGLALIDEFEEVFELSIIEHESVQVIAQGIDIALRSHMSVQHGDFCRQNILLLGSGTSTKIGVIDWTDSKQTGFPLHDLFFFLSTYFMQVRKKRGIDNIKMAFERTFLLSNEYHTLVAKCIAKHCELLNVDQSSIPILFGLFLIEQAIFEYKKMQRCVEYDTLPKFVINLSLNANTSFEDAIKQQPWIYYFKLCVEHRVFIKKDPFQLEKLEK